MLSTRRSNGQRWLQLSCNGCSDRIQCPDTNNDAWFLTLDEASGAARENGWSHLAGEDFCTRCYESYVCVHVLRHPGDTLATWHRLTTPDERP